MKPRHIKVKDFGTAAYGIEIKGNPKQPEPATCLIFIPGGCIEVTRTTTNNYWVHVMAFTDQSGVDCHGDRLDGRQKGRIAEGLFNKKNITPACGVAEMPDGFSPPEGTYCMKVLIEPESQASRKSDCDRKIQEWR